MTGMGPGTRVTFLGDNRLLAAWKPGQNLELWDWKEKRLCAEHSLHDTPTGPHRLAATPDGHILALADAQGNIHLHDCRSFRELKCLSRPPLSAGEGLKQQYGRWLNDLCFSYDGQWLAGLYGDGTLRLWQWTSPSDQHQDIHEVGSDWLAASPVGSVIAVTSNLGFIRVWDLEEQSLRGAAIKAPAGVTCAEFSPDGKVLALAGMDRHIWLVDVEAGVLHRLAGHDLSVTCLAFSPDKRTLASSSKDGTVRLWHVPTRQELFVIHAQGGSVPIQSLAFSPDGKCLVVALGPTVEVWPTEEPFRLVEGLPREKVSR
jgi:WD40 repeat protein